MFVGNVLIESTSKYIQLEHVLLVDKIMVTDKMSHFWKRWFMLIDKHVVEFWQIIAHSIKETPKNVANTPECGEHKLNVLKPKTW